MDCSMAAEGGVYEVDDNGSSGDPLESMKTERRLESLSEKES